MVKLIIGAGSLILNAVTIDRKDHTWRPLLSNDSSQRPRYDPEPIQTCHKPFRFTHLPSELRISILKYVFEAPSHRVGISHDIKIWQNDHGAKSFNINMPPAFRQLFISKAFLAEALPIFARGRVIRVDDVDLDDYMSLFRGSPILDEILKLCFAQSARFVVASLEHSVVAAECLSDLLKHSETTNVEVNKIARWESPWMGPSSLQILCFGSKGSGAELSRHRTSLRIAKQCIEDMIFFPDLEALFERDIYSSTAFRDTVQLSRRLYESKSQCQVQFWVRLLVSFKDEDPEFWSSLAGKEDIVLALAVDVNTCSLVDFRAESGFKNYPSFLDALVHYD